MLAHPDNAGNEAYDLGELLHVDIEVVELILDRLGGDDPGPIPNRTQAPQISSRIQVRVRWLGEVDLGDLRGERCERRGWSGGVGSPCRTAV